LIADAGQVKTAAAMIADETFSSGRLEDELRAAFDWWREAGVDCDFSAVPHNRMVEAEAERTTASAAPRAEAAPADPAIRARPRQEFAPQHLAIDAPVGGERELWPQDLAAVRDWWLADASWEVLGRGQRVPPRGIGHAELLVLVTMPEDGDRERLLAGPRGALVAAFLRAAGIAERSCYFASVLPGAMVHPDWEALQRAGLGDVLAHHLALAAPKRILALGRNILPLLGHDQAQGAAQVTLARGMSATVPVLAAPGPDELLRSAPRRKRLWENWLEWSR